LYLLRHSGQPEKIAVGHRLSAFGQPFTFFSFETRTGSGVLAEGRQPMADSFLLDTKAKT
jgi:hypothetical protein